MRDSEFEKMLELEHEYWWFVGRRHIIKTLLHKSNDTDKILDIGAGVGSNTRLLSEFGSVTSLDNSERAIHLAKQRGVNVLKGSATDLPFENDGINLVTAFDVIEHIEDDDKALSEICRVLKPGGTVLISVPAYKFLWSEHDEALGHKRRYTRSGLKNKIKKAGFEPFKITSAVTLSLPAIILYRLLTKSRGRSEVTYVILPRLINRLLINLLLIESKLIKRINLPVGASIFVLAKKLSS